MSASPLCAHRLQHVFAAPLPSRALLQLETARAYRRVGALSSAGELFALLGRPRDQIGCLVASGRPQEAGQLARDLLAQARPESGERWELLCLQGDLEQRPELWSQAWAESLGRCPLAMRLAGRASLAAGQTERGIAELTLALAVNEAHPEAQFSLGTALLRLERAAEAVPHLALAVHGLSDDGQAWANLSAALQMAGQPDSALHAAQQAGRHAPRDHRVQENLMRLALQCSALSTAVQAARRICTLRHDSAPARLPLVALVALAALPLTSRQPLEAELLFDDCVDHWPSLAEPYVLRCKYREVILSQPLLALLDAARATRLLRAQLALDVALPSAVDRLLAHLATHVRLVLLHGSPDDQRALRAFCRQLLDSLPPARLQPLIDAFPSDL